MEKFSIYDLIGLLLPGYVFVYFCKLLNFTFEVFPDFFILSDNEIGIGIIISLALIFGSLLFALNFFLVKKVKWYSKTLGIYKPVADLYLNMNDLHRTMNDTLNLKSQIWFGRKIFYDSKEFAEIKNDKKKHVRELQNDFYDRMYYELEHEDKLENARTVQSFYYFFRQLVTTFILLMGTTILLEVLSNFDLFSFKHPEDSLIVWLFIFFLSNLIISIILARWFRKRMVMKMYWAYFSHLSLTSNK